MSLCYTYLYRLDYEYYDGDGFSSSPYDYYHHYHHDDYYSPPTSPPPPNCSVIATVRGWLTHDHGGRLESVETGVALLVPPRALPPGPAAHLVYFKVCRQDQRQLDTNGVPLDDGKGIQSLSVHWHTANNESLSPCASVSTRINHIHNCLFAISVVATVVIHYLTIAFDLNQNRWSFT